MTDMTPEQRIDATKKIGRRQIREVFLRNGARIEPDRDDLPDYVYESVFELLEMAAPTGTKREEWKMKKLIIALAVMAAAATAQAETICEAYSGLAETIMDGRQTGTSMAAAIAIVREDAYAAHMVRTAYDQPRWRTGENQRRAIEDFRDAVYLECYKAVEK